jgi:hypothetical protein
LDCDEDQSITNRNGMNSDVSTGMDIGWEGKDIPQGKDVSLGMDNDWEECGPEELTWGLGRGCGLGVKMGMGIVTWGGDGIRGMILPKDKIIFESQGK